MQTKAELRKELRARRAAAKDVKDAAHALALEFKLRCYPKLNLTAGIIVSGYVAMESEICPAEILLFLENIGMQLCLPVAHTDNQALEFRAYKTADELSAKDKYKIDMPFADQPILTPQILLVPLLGFDRRGNRIGYGKGFYDLTLTALRAENPNIIAIGLAFQEQEVPEIPANPHDQPLNFIVTPRETIYCPAA